MSALLVGVTSDAISTPMSGTYIFPTEHPHPFGSGDELKGSMLKLLQLHPSPQLASKNRNRNKNFLIDFPYLVLPERIELSSPA